MDNSPRFNKDILAVDALAQQGLSALYISKLATEIRDSRLANEYEREYTRIKRLINQHYWDEPDGFYYDLEAHGQRAAKIRTPAAFWPVLAGMATQDKVERMAARVLDPHDLGGSPPWVSLSRSHAEFLPSGQYWKGSLWLPLAYMGVRALSVNGQGEIADRTAESIVRHMLATFRQHQPATIWECYSPSEAVPATNQVGEAVRADFCGWSALGPISLLIENVLGFYDVDASTRTVRWRRHQAGRHGIRSLRFGDVDADIVAQADGSIHVSANRDFTLVVNGKSLPIDPCR